MTKKLFPTLIAQTLKRELEEYSDSRFYVKMEESSLGEIFSIQQLKDLIAKAARQELNNYELDELYQLGDISRGDGNPFPYANIDTNEHPLIFWRDFIIRVFGEKPSELNMVVLEKEGEELTIDDPIVAMMFRKLLKSFADLGDDAVGEFMDKVDKQSICCDDESNDEDWVDAEEEMEARRQSWR